MNDSSVYITSIGKYLPGPNISNDEMEEYLGKIHGRDSKAKKHVLKQNGIYGRHYAIDKQQRTTQSNSTLAASAIRDALARRGKQADEIDYLAVATCISDMLAPGFASLVHSELKTPPCEIATFHGVCGSGMMAIRSA